MYGNPTHQIFDRESPGDLPMKKIVEKVKGYFFFYWADLWDYATCDELRLK